MVGLGGETNAGTGTVPELLDHQPPEHHQPETVRPTDNSIEHSQIDQLETQVQTEQQIEKNVIAQHLFLKSNPQNTNQWPQLNGQKQPQLN